MIHRNVQALLFKSICKGNTIVEDEVFGNGNGSYNFMNDGQKKKKKNKHHKCSVIKRCFCYLFDPNVFTVNIFAGLLQLNQTKPIQKNFKLT